MTELEQRNLVIAIARTWLGTPYVSNAMLRHPRGGVDCAMLLVGVYREANIVPPEFDPRPYPSQWHVHKDEERYMNHIKGFAVEIEEPPKPGDIALFKVARTFAHGGIVLDWPYIIHARAPDPVAIEDISKNDSGRHGLARVPRKFFSFWRAT